VVEDFEPFRRLIRSRLQKQPDLQVINEVVDGLDAVEKAKELRPDLILLDIGKLVPESKIVFLSMEDSADVVREALNLGAMGYVVKAHVVGELLAAVEEVRQGRQFVSGGLADDISSSEPACFFPE
jgi:DNA-binding NarL/FixJ family response regulator